MHQANLLYSFRCSLTWLEISTTEDQNCVCMFTYSVFIRLTHKQSVVFRNWLYAKFVNWRDCLNAGCSRGPAKESRGTLPTLPWHLTRQRWLLECLNERPESKELWLIFLQVFLAERISKQHLSPCGRSVICSCGMLFRVFRGLTSKI